MSRQSGAKAAPRSIVTFPSDTSTQCDALRAGVRRERQRIEPGERRAAAIGDSREGGPERRGVAQRRDLRPVAREGDEVDPGGRRLFRETLKHFRLQVGAVGSVRERAVPIDAQAAAARRRLRVPRRPVRKHEEALPTRMAGDDHRPGQRPAGDRQPLAHDRPAERRLAAPAIAASGQAERLAGKADCGRGGIAIGRNGHRHPTDRRVAGERQDEAGNRTEGRDEMEAEAAGVGGVDREDSRREAVSGNLRQPRIDACTYLVLVDVTCLRRLEQLARDHPAADVEGVAGDDRVGREREREVRLVAVCVIRADQHLHTDVGSAADEVGADFERVDSQVGRRRVVAPDTALRLGQRRIALRPGRRG
jgi:hypothetical protein